MHGTIICFDINSIDNKLEVKKFLEFYEKLRDYKLNSIVVLTKADKIL
jgi:GTP-binding protein EngB required for normal cell division